MFSQFTDVEDVEDRASFEAKDLLYNYEVYQKTNPGPEKLVFREPTLWLLSEAGNVFRDGAFPFKHLPFEITKGVAGWCDYQTMIYIVSNEFWPCPSASLIDEMYRIEKPWLREKNICPREHYEYEVLPMPADSIKDVMLEFGSGYDELVVSQGELEREGFHGSAWDLWLPHGEHGQPLLDCFQKDTNDGNTGHYSCKTPNYTYGFSYWRG